MKAALIHLLFCIDFKFAVQYTSYCLLYFLIHIPGESKKQRSAFARLLFPEYISNDILQYLNE